jgi:hypothetical protein
MDGARHTLEGVRSECGEEGGGGEAHRSREKLFLPSAVRAKLLAPAP